MRSVITTWVNQEMFPWTSIFRHLSISFINSPWREQSGVLPSASQRSHWDTMDRPAVCHSYFSRYFKQISSCSSFMFSPDFPCSFSTFSSLSVLVISNFSSDPKINHWLTSPVCCRTGKKKSPLLTFHHRESQRPVSKL